MKPHHSVETEEHLEPAFAKPQKNAEVLANLLSVLEHVIPDKQEALRIKDGLEKFIKHAYVPRDHSHAVVEGIPFLEPKNKTEGLANFVAAARQALGHHNGHEAMQLLADLQSDIGRVYVCDDDAQLVLADLVKLDGTSIDHSEALKLVVDRAAEIYRVPYKNSPIPMYDSQKDGDYSAWLVANNID